MRLFRILIAVAFLFAMNVEDVSAQSWFKRMGEKVSNVVGGAVKGAKQGAKKNRTEAAASSENGTVSSVSIEDEVEIISDYLPASKLQFKDDFSLDQIGGKPSRWEVLKGSADIFKVSKDHCVNIGSATIRPLVGANPKNYLATDWSLEFQYYAHYSAQSDKGNEMTIELHTEDGESFLEICERANGGYAIGAGLNYYHEVLPKSGWNLVQVSMKEGILKVYLNGRRVINRECPVAFNYLQLRGEEVNGDGIFIKDFRLCKQPD